MTAKRKSEKPETGGITAEKKLRIDLLLHERALVASRELGRRMVMAGQVLVNGQVASKPGQLVSRDSRLELKAGPRFVSRGGEKLSAALTEFGIAPNSWVCADVGASTGGFTDCLLQAGARLVYAIDVGYGQLAWSLRQNARVVVMERVNARYLETLPERVRFVCIDASFISLKLLLPVVMGWLVDDGQIVTLIKPQFEAGRDQLGKGGVVRDAAVHEAVLHDIIDFSQATGLSVNGLIPSPITGPSGNVEFLLWLSLGPEGPAPDIALMVMSALERARHIASGDG